MAMNEGAPIIIKKKKSHGHGHHGGAWKVAYADFVTAMMAFFLVMWIMGMSENDRSVVAGYFNDPVGITKAFPKGPPNLGYSGLRHSAGVKQDQERHAIDLERDRRQIDQVKQDVEKFIHAESGKGNAALSILLKSVEVRVTNEGLEIEFIEGKGVAYFDVGSANVTVQAKKIIGEIAPVLARAGRRFYVDGHTDSRAYVGGGYDNFDLSADRAQAVKRALVVSGIKKAQVIGVRAFADTRLRVPSNPMAESNRRVTLVLPFAKQEVGTADQAKLSNPISTEVNSLRSDLAIPRVPRDPHKQ